MCSNGRRKDFEVFFTAKLSRENSKKIYRKKVEIS
jgi:hypothetical protein